MTSWIFQGSPSKFQVDRYLKSKNEILWTIRQREYEKDISVGDVAYIWRADGPNPGTAGIVAKGRIITLPSMMEDDEPDLWNLEPESMVDLRVKINIEEIRLTTTEGMLLKRELKEDAILNDMPIITTPRKTNYKLSPECASRINSLWENK